MASIIPYFSQGKIGARMFVARRWLREKRAIARQLRLNPTPEEALLWQHLRRNQVSGQHFRRQHVLAGFVVDFYCRSAGLVIELDGRHHEDQKEADAEREAVLRGLGLTVMRFPNRQVREGVERVVELIEAKVILETGKGELAPGDSTGEKGTSIGLFLPPP